MYEEHKKEKKEMAEHLLIQNPDPNNLPVLTQVGSNYFLQLKKAYEFISFIEYQLIYLIYLSSIDILNIQDIFI